MNRKTISILTAMALFLAFGASALAEETATTGSLVVNQVGAVGTVAVAGPLTASITSESSTIAAAAVGSYTITVTAPSGFVLDSVKDGANVVLVSPYAQTLAAGATVTYNVNYVVVPAPGTIALNQTGGIGTVALAGLSATSITTATYSNTSAAVGSYTITVTAPTGFVLDTVKDGANVVLVSPYTQALTTGATVTFNVNYVTAPVTTTPPATEITKQMIKDKTAACAKMEAGDAKKACMKERNEMKRAFQKQEKAKRDLAREEAKKKYEQLKEQMKKDMEALKAKADECKKIEDKDQKKECLNALRDLANQLFQSRNSKLVEFKLDWNKDKHGRLLKFRWLGMIKKHGHR